VVLRLLVVHTGISAGEISAAIWITHAVVIMVMMIRIMVGMEMRMMVVRMKIRTRMAARISAGKTAGLSGEWSECHCQKTSLNL
jgi:hypothetical protein